MDVQLVLPPYCIGSHWDCHSFRAGSLTNVTAAGDSTKSLPFGWQRLYKSISAVKLENVIHADFQITHILVKVTPFKAKQTTNPGRSAPPLLRPLFWYFSTFLNKLRISACLDQINLQLRSNPQGNAHFPVELTGPTGLSHDTREIPRPQILREKKRLFLLDHKFPLPYAPLVVSWQYVLYLK